MGYLQDFVDREEELEIFRQMLRGERPQRVLDICAGGGTGKSYLLRHMREVCREKGVPCGLAAFGGEWQPDPVKLMRELAERLGETLFPGFCGEEKRCRPAPEGEGDAASLRKQLEAHRRHLAVLEEQKATLGVHAPPHVVTGIEHEQAEIAKLEAQLAAVEGRRTEDREQLLRVLSQAFYDDLLSLAGERPVVFLLDAYEHTPGETADWIQKWLLQGSIREQETHLIVVLAGRPAGSRPCFEPWGSWWRIVVRRDRLSPLRYEHVHQYLCDICGLSLEEAHLKAYHVAVQDDPLTMSQIAANLGGRR